MTSSTAFTTRLDTAPSTSGRDTGNSLSHTSLHYPVIFRNVQYSSASEALEAYIRDYDGQIGGAVHTDVHSLLTANVTSDLTGPSCLELEKLVDESYEKLQATDDTTNQATLSLSRQTERSVLPAKSQPSFSTSNYNTTLNGNSTFPGTSAPSVGRIHSDGRRAPPSWVEEAARSDLSSIISGHLLKRPASGDVLVSTPRRHTGGHGGLSDVSTGPLSLSELAGAGGCRGDRNKSAKPSTGVSDIDNEHHRQYLLSLVRDIEQGSSDVVSSKTRDEGGDLKAAEDKPSNRTVHFEDEETRLTSADVGSTEWVLPCTPPHARTRGGGYADRVQQLINSDASPGSPSELPDPDLSPVTSVETERPWERLPPARSPVYVRETREADMDEAASQIMEECLSIVSQHDQTDGDTLSGGSHPGGMEALKNMLFTIQSMSHTVADDSQPPSHNTQRSNSAHNSQGSASSSLHTSTSSNPSSVNTSGTAPRRDEGSGRTRTDSSLSLTTTSSSSDGSKLTSQPYNKAMEHITKLKTLIDFDSTP